ATLLDTCAQPTVFVFRAGDRDRRATMTGLPLLYEDGRYAAYGPCLTPLGPPSPRRGEGAGPTPRSPSPRSGEGARGWGNMCGIFGAVSLSGAPLRHAERLAPMAAPLPPRA